MRARLREADALLAGTHFKDPVLGLYALEEKLARRAVVDADRRPTAPGNVTTAEMATDLTGER